MSQADEDFKEIVRIFKERGEAAAKAYTMQLPPARRKAAIERALQELIDANTTVVFIERETFSNN